MRRMPTLLAAIAALALALAPALAEARVGGGSSYGSRGSRSFTPPPATSTAPRPAAPLERSYSTPGGTSSTAPRPGYAQPAPMGGGLFRSPFTSGLLGGLLGVGLGGLLFGHGLFGSGGGLGFFGLIGLLLQIALIVLLVRFALNWFRNRAPQPAMAGGPTRMARQAAPGYAGYGSGSGDASGAAPIRLEKADFDAFERALKGLNEAWSRQDLPALRRLATPEMAQYFADDMAELARRGLRNEVRDVNLEQGDLAEAWREGNRDYASVAMRYSLADVTRRQTDGAVVEGDPNRRTEATEVWTFTR
ncbi:MAG TPA: Tim44 domain-containing protein, partial [Crenalkalicoccus sp.]|nr:Tim44 domain-containing protein [Crenalkalicoccus sp.]